VGIIVNINIKWNSNIMIANSTSSGVQTNRKQLVVIIDER
jgi:hypothetical protein